MPTYSFDACGNITSRGPGSVSPPKIVGQPVGQTIRLGDFASFSVVVSNTSGVLYQWAFNGTSIPGATGDSLLLTSVSVGDVGKYTVTVTNGVGTVTSSPVALSLDTTPAGAPTPRAQLTAYGDAGGSVTVTPTKISYDQGESVVLTATPSPPNTFLGWDGLSAGGLVTVNPVTVTLPGDQTVRARFASPVSIPPGLVALWRGDAGVSDVIGHHSGGGFFVGASPTAPKISPTGKVGAAFDFDGTTHMRVPDSIEFMPPHITLEAWVFPTLVNASNSVIARGSATNNTDMWWLGVNGLGRPDFWSHGSHRLSGPLVIPENQWTHLAATFEGSTKRLFVDGVEVASAGGLGPLVYDPNQSSVPVTIGADWTAGAPTDLFTGLIDEVCLYRRALTANEIFAIAKADFVGKNITHPYFTTVSPLPAVTPGASFLQQLETVLGLPPVSFTLSEGALPPGMTLSSTGVVSGVCNVAGVFDFTVAATDASAKSTERLYVLRVQPPIAPPPDLVGWWRGESAAGARAEDSIGIHHGGFFSGTTAAAPSYAAAGKVGEAFEFDGAHYIQIPDAPDLRPPEVTVEAWMLFTTLNANHQTVISRGSATDSSNRWWLGVAGGRPRFWSHGLHLLEGPPLIRAGQWAHLAATFDGSTKRLFVNGVEVASAGGLGPLLYDPNQSVPVTIGADWTAGAPTDLFTGLIDEVCLYRRALTANEIFAIAEADAAGKSADAPYITSPTQLSAVAGQPYVETLTSVLGAPPVTYSLAADNTLEPALTLTASGVLSGTPTIAGHFGFTVRATDAAGQSSEQRCMLKVFADIAAPGGIVGWWRAEGDAQDSEATNHAVLRNGAGFAAGKVGTAFALNAVAACVEIPDAPALRPTSLTLEAWVMFDVTSGIRVIVAKPVGAGASNSYALWLNSGYPTGVVGDPTGVGSVLGAPDVLTQGRWYHLAYTVDDGIKKQALYVNGAQVTSGVATKTAGYDAQPLFLGCDKEYGAPNYFLQGRIDEIAIYNRALNPAEIASIYDAGPAGKRPPP